MPEDISFTHEPLPTEAAAPQGTSAPLPEISLLDIMKDGREFSSLVTRPNGKINLRSDLEKALRQVQTIRGRPLLCYVGNLLRGSSISSIELSDDVPFSEMVDAIPAEHKEVDILIATSGGSGHQVSSFVHKLRPRFSHVSFIVPHKCMSAGTIWVTSGNEIVMDERGFLGPIDPQIRNRDGQFVPAQALFTLVEKIKEDGQAAIQKAQAPAWTDVQLLRLLDPKELGAAIASTDYAIGLVREYLIKYKFADWVAHSDGSPVTDTDREKRADEVARLLSSHSEWKTHGHGIFRDAVWQKLRIKVTHPDPALTRAIRRLWALFYWSFEHTGIQKSLLSENYFLMKGQAPATKPK